MAVILPGTVLMLAAATVGAEAAPFTLYVAPNGRDGWSGMLAQPKPDGSDGPLASLAGAQDALRRLRAASADAAVKPVRVIIADGVYRLSEPFVLEPRDSGTAEAPVVYEAAPGARPIFSGGAAITGWKKGPGELWQVTLPEVASGEWYFNQLWVNGQRRVRARTPNEGYFTIVRKGPPAVDPVTGAETPQDRTAFVYQPGDIKPWPDIEDANVVVFHSWEVSRLRIARLDEGNHLVHFTGPAWWPFESWGPGQRYYVENVREALDAPGEWYLDRRSGVLSYYPMAGEDMTKAEVIAPRLRRLVELRGDPFLGLWVEHVTFRGLSFCHADWELEPQGHSDPQAAVTIPAAVMADGARHCVWEDCEIAHVGEYGMWLRRGCKNNKIARCRIRDLGTGGVRIGEANPANEDEAESSHNVVDNNHIYDGGHVYASGVGVWVAQSSHNVIAHNEIHDFNYSGMSIGWNWDDAPNRTHHNVIEYNHVHHVMNHMLNDGGAIYTLGTSPGSVIRGNLFHDVWPYSAIGWGIYLDATTNGYLVENNIVYNTLSGGLMYNNGGHENVIRNNIFAFSAEYALWPYWERRPNTFVRNIIYMTQGVLFIPYAENTLRQRIDAGEQLGEWDYNCYWHTGQPDFPFFRYSFAEWQAMGLDKHSVVADPMFVDADEYDFRLRPESPALRLGFRQIDASRAGLYGARTWVEEPKLIVHRRTELPPPSPPPRPRFVDDDFENTAAGQQPERCFVSGEEKGASIRVSTEQAAGGKHAVKLSDVPGLEHIWEPHFFYQPHITDGQVLVSFDILLQPGARVLVEGRDS
ncbi:MAG: right-handed parallel beta-helix repeat-containing protein, partial [Armatimonadetes bacterium]|nr:right-handed parallel beta-helix repeat-containing protein [Armatimonadota bacterium]